jgi:hypothetical protein
MQTLLAVVFKKTWSLLVTECEKKCARLVRGNNGCRFDNVGAPSDLYV